MTDTAPLESFDYRLSKLMTDHLIYVMNGNFTPDNQDDCHTHIDDLAKLCADYPEQAANFLYSASDILRGARAELLLNPSSFSAKILLSLNSNFVVGAVKAEEQANNQNLSRASKYAFKALKKAHFYLAA